MKGIIMDHIQTLAIRITKDTYPIAVACLAAGFATIPLDKVLDRILVINELEAKYVKGYNERPLLVISNSWMDAELFNKTYRVRSGQDVHEAFAEVVPI